MNDRPDVSRVAIFGLIGVAVAVAIIAVVTVVGRNQSAPTNIVAESSFHQGAAAPDETRSAAIQAEIERLRIERDRADREAAELRARAENGANPRAQQQQARAPRNALAGQWSTWSSWTEVEATVVFTEDGRVVLTTPGYEPARANWSLVGDRLTVRFDHGPVYYATLSGNRLNGEAHPDASSEATGTFRWTRQTS